MCKQNKLLDARFVQSYSNYTDMHMGVKKYLRNATSNF